LKGLRDFIKGIFGHKTTTTTTTESTEQPTTPKPHRFFTYSLSFIPTTKSLLSGDDIKNDAFYKLKNYCQTNYDDFCIRKKKEIYDLISKCNQIKTAKQEEPQACKDVVSIYCYVFLTRDASVCLLQSYTTYQPGKYAFNNVLMY
jgi:hypothetical protein